MLRTRQVLDKEHMADNTELMKCSRHPTNVELQNKGKPKIDI